MTEDPFAAPSSAPSINKIPFLVFDGILVITAVALAFSAGGPLNPMLFFWILLCVVGGGLVACLPFWIEFRDKVRLSEYEIRERQNNIHDSQWQYVDARLVEQNEYLQKLHLRLSDSAERLAALERRPPTPTADELAVLCGSALQKQWPDWREELLSTLSRRTDILFNEQNAQSAKLSAAHDKRLTELRTEFNSVQSVLRGLETRVGEIALLSVAAGTAVVAQSAQATALLEPSVKSAPLSVNPTVATERVAEADASQDEDAAAIDLADDTASALADTAETDAIVIDTDAIESAADVIEAAAEQPDCVADDALLLASEEEETQADADDQWAEADSEAGEWADADAGDSEDWDEADSQMTAADADLAAEDTYVEAVEDESTAVAFDEDAQSAETDVIADAPVAPDPVVAEETFIEELATAEAAAADAAENVESTVAEPVEPITEPVAKPAEQVDPVADKGFVQTPPEQPALLETPEPVARPKKTAPAEHTTLVAQVLIGIGNKPYVRGIGPGLSLTKGVPMQFVEIGKWEWVCPAGSVPVKIQIYKNDDTASTLGEIELEAGQRKAVTPFFPK